MSLDEPDGRDKVQPDLLRRALDPALIGDPKGVENRVVFFFLLFKKQFNMSEGTIEFLPMYRGEYVQYCSKMHVLYT